MELMMLAGVFLMFPLLFWAIHAIGQSRDLTGLTESVLANTGYTVTQRSGDLDANDVRNQTGVSLTTRGVKKIQYQADSKQLRLTLNNKKFQLIDPSISTHVQQNMNNPIRVNRLNKQFKYQLLSTTSSAGQTTLLFELKNVESITTSTTAQNKEAN